MVWNRLISFFIYQYQNKNRVNSFPIHTFTFTYLGIKVYLFHNFQWPFGPLVLTFWRALTQFEGNWPEGPLYFNLWLECGSGFWGNCGNVLLNGTQLLFPLLHFLFFGGGGVLSSWIVQNFVWKLYFFTKKYLINLNFSIIFKCETSTIYFIQLDNCF